MYDKTSINYLKELLFLEVKDLQEKDIRKDELQTSKENLVEIIKLLTTEDYADLYDNGIYISFLIDYLLSTKSENGKENIKSTFKKIIANASYLLKDYQLKGLVEEKEYKQKIADLNKIVKYFAIQLDSIEVELDFLNEKNLKGGIITCRAIITKLKYKQILLEEDIKFLNNFFEEKKLDSKIQIILLEKLKNHNSYLATVYNNANYRNPEERYTILNMLSSGFEKLEGNKGLSGLAKQRINNEIEKLLSTIGYYEDNLEIVKELLPKIENKIYSPEETEEILFTILKKYQEKIYDQIEMISDKNFYMDEELREDIKADYFKYIGIYNFIRGFYDKILEEKDSMERLEEVDKEIVTSENNLENILIFSRNYNEEGFIEKDIKSDIPEEYYDNVLYLLNQFKINKLTSNEIKQFYNHQSFKGIKELKTGQVRIIIKQIRENYYCVLGAGVKKDDYDSLLYNRLCNREVTDISSPQKLNQEEEISRIIEKRLIKTLEDEARKSNR